MNLTGSNFSIAQEYLKRNGGRIEYALNDFYDHVDTVGGLRLSYKPRLVAVFEKYSCDGGKHWDSDGLVRYIEDMGLSVEDPVTLCLSNFLSINDPEELISCEQFLNPWADANCENLAEMLEHLKKLKEKLENDETYFRSIYLYAFPLNLDAGERELSRDVAADYWKLFFAENKYALKTSKDRLETWLNFIYSDNTDRRKTHISKDTWLMFYKFVKMYPDDERLKNEYDEMAAWPLILDEYYEYLDVIANN